jgi:transposase-like protein
MTKRTRRNCGVACKAKVAIAGIRGEQRLVELSQQFEVHANQISQCKDWLFEGGDGCVRRRNEGLANGFDRICQNAARKMR